MIEFWWPLTFGTLLSVCMSYGLVRLLITRSMATGLIDRPNERSSHTVPTPRGGGVGFVVTFFAAAIGTQWYFAGHEFGFATWLLPGSAAIAILGFLDDRFSLKASQRLAVQLLAAAAALSVLFMGLPSKSPFAGTPNVLGAVVALLSFLWIVWMTNLYNFMDGIDGYAAVEAVLVATAMAALLWRHDLAIPMTLYLLFAGAVGGFLLLNWAPAKIFMGDAGSTFLGFFFAVMAVALQVRHSVPIETSVVLLGTFVVDATYTLLVRVKRGKKAYVAHRDHAYQHAVQRGWSHRRTVLFFSAITVCWLMPVATVISETQPEQWPHRLALVALAFLPLVFVEYYFRAGVERAT